MQCLQCQHHNPEGAKFCNACAAPVIPICPVCATENPAGANFCHQCATNLQAPTSDSVSVQSIQQDSALDSRFYALIPDIIGLLRSESRLTYRRLTYAFSLDDTLREEIRKELAFRQLAHDERGEGLVWTGEVPAAVLPTPAVSNQLAVAKIASIPSPVIPVVTPPVTTIDTGSNGPTTLSESLPIEVSPDEPVPVAAPARSIPEAERRQLTVMFCDLVGSTDLSGKLDPEDLREVVRAYQKTAAEVIERYEGHIAQYLGDGLLVYFGFPVAHEDDAQRAVYTGLGIPEAMRILNTRLQGDYGVQLAVRIGMHTGPVVVGEMGSGGRHENLALGETPNIAARLEGLAQANTVVMSPVTAQLVQRSFVLEDLGLHELKGVAEPMRLSTVVRPREVGCDDDGALLSRGFATLVGRDEEIGLLLRRWDQSKAGLGQVVILSGEAGIGKSSLVDGLRDHVRQAGGTRIVFRSSPYHTNSAFYPIIEHVQRALDWQPDDTVDTRLAKLEQALAGTSLPLADAVPVLASLLSLPVPEGRYAALTWSPQQQRQQTQDMLVAWLLEEAERRPVLAVWEDLHWADPSTLETLGLVVEQAPTATMLHVLTFRPEFAPPWPSRSHLTPITLNRLERPQVEALVYRLAGGKRLPEEVVAHIVGKTDGVPLYVEELTKMLLASDLLREDVEQYVLTGPLLTVAIPGTLQDSLMARLDQMNTAKEVAQLGSVLGREFAYDMLQALAWQDEETLQAALAQLVQAELLYQRGRPPRARYIFKHALIQDAAYASLLRSVRQGYHQQMAQLLEARFPEVVETQPELVAHHYTEAGRHEQAIGYWRQAGQQALQRSAYAEALNHLTTGFAVLEAVADTPERLKYELSLHTTLGPALMATKGQTAAEVGQTYARARELCQQLGEPPEFFPVLMGLWRFHAARGDHQVCRELSEQLLHLAKGAQDAGLLLEAHMVRGITFCHLRELISARTHLEQALALYDPQQHHAHATLYVRDPGVVGGVYLAQTLWFLGYPDQALARSQAALTLAHALGHPLSLAFALHETSVLHWLYRNVQAVRERADASITLTTEQNLGPWILGRAMIMQGGALVAQGQEAEGLARMQQGLTTLQAIGGVTSMYLSILAESHLHLRQAAEGLCLLPQESQTDWLRGELLLRQARPDTSQAATCFQQALDIARTQQAKSLELRAATSLARLWQAQDKRQDAYDLLAPVYEWFTEGLDTADLEDAKALLSELRI